MPHAAGGCCRRCQGGQGGDSQGRQVRGPLPCGLPGRGHLRVARWVPGEASELRRAQRPQDPGVGCQERPLEAQEQLEELQRQAGVQLRPPAHGRLQHPPLPQCDHHGHPAELRRHGGEAESHTGGAKGQPEEVQVTFIQDGGAGRHGRAPKRFQGQGAEEAPGRQAGQGGGGVEDAEGREGEEEGDRPAEEGGCREEGSCGGEEEGGGGKEKG
mmetsp:Transcript_8039/g.24417  ORF Transcript_8039/g.24417 Transcript_8039/m.24417 type:complete len:214 (+) Transcript_8039:866-1507(+)